MEQKNLNFSFEVSLLTELNRIRENCTKIISRKSNKTDTLITFLYLVY